MGEAKRKKTAGLYLVKGGTETLMAMADRRLRAFEAADKGDLDTLKPLIHTSHEANWKHPEFGIVLLDKAVNRNDIDMLHFLLGQGANPNALIECDQLVQWPTHVGDGMYFSPLASAISDGRAEILAALLEAGADLNLPKWIDGESGECMTCRDALNDSPELLAAIEALALEKTTTKACSPSRTQRI